MFLSVMITLVFGFFLIMEALTVHRRAVIVGMAAAIILAWLLPIFTGA